MRAQLANGQLGGLTVAAQRVCVCACVACLSMWSRCVCAVLLVRAVSGTVWRCVSCVPAPRMPLVLFLKPSFFRQKHTLHCEQIAANFGSGKHGPEGTSVALPLALCTAGRARDERHMNQSYQWGMTEATCGGGYSLTTRTSGDRPVSHPRRAAA